jgi:hypothetical protein
VRTGEEVKLYTANQTLLFPPMYMIDRFWQVESLVFMAEAQYASKHQRGMELLTKNGPIYAGPSLVKRGRRPLNEILLAEPDKWLEKFARLLQMTYGRCSGYRKLHEALLTDMKDCLSGPDATIADLGEWSIGWTLAVLGLCDKPDLMTSTELIGERPADASEWLLKIGLTLKATDYLGGGSAMQGYMDHDLFEQHGIRLWHQDWECAGYKSLNGWNTNGWISCLDPLMVGGPDLLWDLMYSTKRCLVRTTREYCYQNRPES